MLADMWIEPGMIEDWNVLHEFHYKTESRVAGARYYRVMHEERLVGICVMCYPRGLLRARHKAFPRLKPGGGDTHITNVHRYKFLNRQFGLNARTVNDTMFRGVGVGYRMLNLAARMDGREFCEIQSSMSKFNMFAQRAGFRFVRPDPPPFYKLGVEFYETWFDAQAADQVALMLELNDMPSGLQKRCIKMMKAFYYKHSALEKTGGMRGQKGVDHVQNMEPKLLIKNINQLCFASPLYGVYKNPDYEMTIPSRLPLNAFDWQDVNQPLDPIKMEEFK